MKKIFTQFIACAFFLSIVQNISAMKAKKSIRTYDNKLEITIPNTGIYKGPQYKKALQYFYNMFQIDPKLYNSYVMELNEETPLKIYAAYIDIHAAIIKDAMKDFKREPSQLKALAVDDATKNFERIRKNLKLCSVEHVYNYMSALAGQIEEERQYLLAKKHTIINPARANKHRQLAKKAHAIYLHYRETLPIWLQINKFSLTIKIKENKDKELSAILVHSLTDQFVPLPPIQDLSVYKNKDVIDIDPYLKKHICKSLYLCALCNKTLKTKNSARRHVRCMHFKTQYKNKKRKRDLIT